MSGKPGLFGSQRGFSWESTIEEKNLNKGVSWSKEWEGKRMLGEVAETFWEHSKIEKSEYLQKQSLFLAWAEDVSVEYTLLVACVIKRE